MKNLAILSMVLGALTALCDRVVVEVAATHPLAPWQRAEAYVAGLRCNMSEAELRAYSERYPQLQICNPDEPELLIAWKGSTQILLWLGAGGLTAYQLTWTYPLTNFDSQLKTDVCSGAKYVELNLVGDSELAGAVVWLDGERVGALSRTGTFTWACRSGSMSFESSERAAAFGTGSFATTNPAPVTIACRFRQPGFLKARNSKLLK